MIFIYLPNLVLFLTWLYYVELNIFLSIIITPLSYLAINGSLIYYKQFNLVHDILDKTIVLPFTENQIKRLILYLIGLIFKISYVNKLYSVLKVKIFVYLFNIIANYMSSTTDEKNSELTSELKNDYMEILNRNRRRTVSPAIRNNHSDSTMD